MPLFRAVRLQQAEPHLTRGGVTGHDMPQHGKPALSRRWPSWRSGRVPRRPNRRTSRPPPCRYPGRRPVGARSGSHARIGAGQRGHVVLDRRHVESAARAARSVMPADPTSGSVNVTCGLPRCPSAEPGTPLPAPSTRPSVARAAITSPAIRAWYLPMWVSSARPQEHHRPRTASARPPPVRPARRRPPESRRRGVPPTTGRCPGCSAYVRWRAPFVGDERAPVVRPDGDLAAVRQPDSRVRGVVAPHLGDRSAGKQPHPRVRQPVGHHAPGEGFRRASRPVRRYTTLNSSTPSGFSQVAAWHATTPPPAPRPGVAPRADW